jgi:son of sevenless-like protein
MRSISMTKLTKANSQGNPDLLREKPHQINFHKRSKASELILQIKLHQATSFNLQQVPQVAKWLQEMLFPAQVHPDAETQLYNLSLALEPRERDDEKVR